MRTLQRKQQAFIIGLLCLMVVIGRMAFDIYIPAMPIIQQNLLSNAHQLQLSIALFSLGFGVSQLFYGPCSDYFGRRSVLFIGLAIFIVGSVFSYYAPSIQQLIVGRFISGVGVGAGVVISRAISRDLFDGKALASVASSQTLALTMALFVAPILGGYLMHWFSWRADFLFLVVLGIVCLCIFYFFLPETHKNRNTQDRLFSQSIKNYSELLTHSQFLKNVAVTSLSFSGLVMYFQLTPFIFEKQYGLSALAYSWLSLLIAFAYIVGTISLNRQLKKYSLNQIMAKGIRAMLLAGLSMTLMSFFKVSSLVGILFASMLYIYGLRLIMPTASAACLSPFKNKSGAAAALLGAMVMGVSALVSFIAACIHVDFSVMLGLIYAILALVCLIIYPRR